MSSRARLLPSARGWLTVSVFNSGSFVAEENRDARVWGTRVFPRKTPLKVKLGNKLNCLAAKLTTGVSVRDTGSGLCAFSDLLTAKMLEASTGKGDFERAVLRCCKRARFPVPQVRVRNQDIA